MAVNGIGVVAWEPRPRDLGPGPLPTLSVGGAARGRYTTADPASLADTFDWCLSAVSPKWRYAWRCATLAVSWTPSTVIAPLWR